MVPDGGEVGPWPGRLAGATLTVCPGSCCNRASPAGVPLRRSRRPGRPRRGGAAAIRSTGGPRGGRSVPAAVRPGRWSSWSCLRRRSGRTRPTCCCAGTTTGRPGRAWLPGVPRSWTSTGCRSPTTPGRRPSCERSPTRRRNGPTALLAWRKRRPVGAANGRAGTASSDADRQAPTAPGPRARRAAGSPPGRSAPRRAPDLSSSWFTPVHIPRPSPSLDHSPGHAGQGQTTLLTTQRCAAGGLMSVPGYRSGRG
jgi:hypothetical protein